MGNLVKGIMSQYRHIKVGGREEAERIRGWMDMQGLINLLVYLRSAGRI
jgi:hypothetical protein